MSDDAEAKPWVRREDGECPVGLYQQAWIESSMRWFVDQFGMDVVRRDIALPTNEFLPDPYTGTIDEIADVFYLDVWPRFESKVAPVYLSLAREDGEEEDDGTRTDGARAVGHYQVKNGRPFIWLDPDLASELRYLVAVMAHEMCHVKLLGEGRIDPDRKDQERLTDLLTVYFGFGIFSTNAAFEYEEADRRWKAHPIGYLDEYSLNAARSGTARRLGYLDEPEFGYAMACYAWLRGEPDPAWARHLDPGPRMYLRQGLRHLSTEAGPGEFRTTRQGGVSVRFVPGGHRSLPRLYLPVPAPARPPAPERQEETTNASAPPT
jgi:hypothetical protein